MPTATLPPVKRLPVTPTAKWTYEAAFQRNLGLISADEQQKLRNSRVAIAGLGGVGGEHLIACVRLGIGKFTVADPDVFEVANFNRQYGAKLSTLGRSKVDVMCEEAWDINPELDIRSFTEGIAPDNIDDFLAGADVVIDGLDFFAIEARRLLFREARRRGLWAITAGPIGCSVACISFSPTGISFDDYCGIRDAMSRRDQLIAFATALTPKATQLGYIDLETVSFDAEHGPSTVSACRLSSGVASEEAKKILLGRGPTRPAPWFQQFDAHRQKFRTGKLRFGNRGPWQRLKRWWLRKQLTAG